MKIIEYLLKKIDRFLKGTALVFLGFQNHYLVSTIKLLQLLQMLPLVSLQLRRKSRFEEIILFYRFFI